MSDGHGGWYGDPVGHSEAAKLGWAHRRRERLQTAGAKGYAEHETACNWACSTIAREMDCDELDDMTANEQVDYLEENWTSISAEEARERAERGELVVAGLGKDKGSGHVGVIYPGKGAIKPDKKFYPNVICGGTNPAGRSDGSLTVGDVWNRKDRAKVKYYIRPTRH